jgi:prepilin-type N-terminal cleavage/methylation domain-containing protein
MLHGFWQSERGFSLMEVLYVIIIMGIVMTAGMSIWLGAIESRKVDSATNQLVADLRQAHTRAINRLAVQTVTLTAGNSEYTVPGGTTYDLDNDPDEDVISVAAASTIVFTADGEAQVTGAGLEGNPITVRVTNNAVKNHTIEINPITSRIEVDGIEVDG